MDDKNKAIKEMAKIMEECCNVYDDKGRHVRNKCNTFDCEYYCDTNHVCCSFGIKEATALYNAGYRNEKETAREILQTIRSYDGWNELGDLRDDIAETYGIEVE